MTGAVINFAAIAIGAAAGMLLRGGIPDPVRKCVTQSMGLAVIVIALKMAF